MRSARSFISIPRLRARRAPGFLAPTPGSRPTLPCNGPERWMRFPRAPHGDAARSIAMHIESQRALSPAAHPGCVDPSAARRGGDARGGAGPDRRARFFGLSFDGVPIEDPDQARRCHRGAPRGRLSLACRSPPTPTCTTWCATSSARCSRCSGEADPRAAMLEVLASARSPSGRRHGARVGIVPVAGRISPGFRDPRASCPIWSKLAHVLV